MPSPRLAQAGEAHGVGEDPVQCTFDPVDMVGSVRWWVRRTVPRSEGARSHVRIWTGFGSPLGWDGLGNRQTEKYTSL